MDLGIKFLRVVLLLLFLATGVGSAWAERNQAEGPVALHDRASVKGEMLVEFQTGASTKKSTAGPSAEFSEFVYIPLILKNYISCTPDPPGESENIPDALIVCSGQNVTGQVNEFTDTDDVYKIYGLIGQVLTISMTGTGDDADLYIFYPSATDLLGVPFAVSAESGITEYLQETLTENGYWYIDIFAYDGTSNYSLTITVSEAAPPVVAEFTATEEGYSSRMRE